VAGTREEARKETGHDDTFELARSGWGVLAAHHERRNVAQLLVETQAVASVIGDI
jgi:hypothetical protein